MRAPRTEGDAILAEAKLRRAALASVEFGVADARPPEFEAGLRGPISPRLERRLFAALAERNGDPAMLAAEVRLLVGMTDDQRHRAAIAAGLTYHLPAIGAVMDRSTIDKLTDLFGTSPLRIALSLADLSPKTIGPLDIAGEALTQLVEADGWAILDLWAAEQGLARAWRGWSRKAAGGSLSLIAGAALAIASAVVRHGDFSQGTAE